VQQSAHRDTPNRHHPSEDTRAERTQRVLTHGTPSVTPSIANATVIKYRDVFFLTTFDGSVPLKNTRHGLGLYYHGCRFLDGYELRVAGTRPSVLVSTATRGYMATLELTNPDLRMRNGALIPKETIGIRWDRVIAADELALHERITLENFGLEHVTFPVSLVFRSRFDDIFVVRGMPREDTGTTRAPRWRDGVLGFVHRGIDDVFRSLSIHLTPAPSHTDRAAATFEIALPSRASAVIELRLMLAESGNEADVVAPRVPRQPDLEHTVAALERATTHWAASRTRFQTGSPPLRRLARRSLRDLGMLRTWLDAQEFFAAGVPWFVTLFGRDSLITAIQMLAFDPDVAVHTLRILASHQGTTVDAWRDEQPGKILHELRIDELTRAGRLPYSPYYGTVDATPLFLILVGLHASWSGDLAMFHALRSHIDRALEWMWRYGDTNDDGYIDYRSTSTDGLSNQGWKDSGDAIMNADGSLATAPIALVEVQGYAYLATRLMADLFRRAGDGDRAGTLEREAAALKARFNADFWMPTERFFALALQANQRQAAVISSNPGQALWTGIIDDDKARATMERLMTDDMFSGWGIRTLSTTAKRYNPIGYHLGTVWPHDNSIIVAGFRRYGFDDAAQRVANGIFDAAGHFKHLRLPELFAGFARERFGVPVRYSVACHPQAWAAGATALLLESLLGLVPDAFAHRLRIVRPLLPRAAEWIELHHVAVGAAHADLRFERRGDEVLARVLRVQGDLEVTVETSRASEHVPA
jgi:glycogen debranching enzyme